MKRLIMILILALWTVPCFAAQGYFICKVQGGWPMLSDLPYYGFSYAGQKGDMGIYLISGTEAQLDAIAAAKDVTALGRKSVVTTTTTTTAATIEKKSLEMQPLTKEMATKISATTAKPVSEATKPETVIVDVAKTYVPTFKLDSISIADPDDAVVGEKITPIEVKPVDKEPNEEPLEEGVK